ncbi:hypothetical protein AGR2A_Lc30002 [Agrobacterium genomosp. 2 str. CFBP 5494]|uniref:Uncharacterized protein n=1 Tax=Agrobacterium genomosp. 2 str. CFBP 5494 TaxID=1183436 RepID=A0A9W5B417_9HYPH|nr:hypothetical protein AGR2A_Lc30002 [Agrobacterium genomosp. 2 str. CFBP 5494]
MVSSRPNKHRQLAPDRIPLLALDKRALKHKGDTTLAAGLRCTLSSKSSPTAYATAPPTQFVAFGDFS